MRRTRIAADGPNELTEGQRISPIQMVLGQFKSLIIWILIAAGVVSAVLGEGLDAIAILAIVVLNAAIGFYQEFNAEKSIAALKKMTAPLAKVKRDGQVASIPASGIVAGDILVLEAGDVVAADGRLLTAASLTCVESALTGESETVPKQPATLEPGDLPLGERANMVFMGTSVAAGTGQAVVVATAMKTELGRIAGLIEAADADRGTPLQRKLDSFGRILVWVALGIVALLFGLGLLRGTKPMELFMTSVGLAVAAVPEGLPAVVTVALSLGVLRMARRRALVRKLAAVETLGSTSVICTDKTGTLTVGAMTVRVLYVAGQSYEVTGEGYGPAGEVRFEGKSAETPHLAPLRELATVLHGCNQAHLVEKDGVWSTVGDPTEGALLVAGTKAGGDRKRLEQELPKQQEFPFDSDRKRSSVIRRMPDGKLRAFVNGAPGLLLERCTQVYTREGIRPLTAADMIITDDNFATIVAAVEEGRGIYANIRKTLQYLLAGNTAELLLMTVCVIIGLPTPLLPIHLLWINLVTDGLPALCLATDPIDSDVMQRHPRPRSESITNRSFLRTMVLTGFLTAGVAFAVYLHVRRTGTPESARTYAFAVLVFAELLRSFGARSETKPVWRISLFTNIQLVVVVVFSFGIQLWSQHNAILGRFLKTSFMPYADGLLLLALGAIPLLVLELVKVVRNKLRSQGSPLSTGSRVTSHS